MASTLAQECLDGVYDSELGIPARYTSQPDLPGGGIVTDVRILPDQSDGQYQALDFDVKADRTIFTLRKSEIGICRRDDLIQYPYPDGAIYKVQGDPRLHDIEKIEWSLELVEVSS